MSLTPLPAFKDLVPKAESFEIFQKSLGSSFLVSFRFYCHQRSISPSRGGSNSKSRRSCDDYNGGHGHGRGKRAPIPSTSNLQDQGHIVDRCGASDWFTDTDASAYMTPDPSQLDKVEPYHGKDCVIVGNGASLPITHTGTPSLSSNFKLLDVLVVPRLTKNLLSISKLTLYFPFSVIFSHDNFVVQNRVTGGGGNR
ncbi:hypothetical protein AAG906_003283 [Vitis piasezkii]